jgi:hypothetical protein
MTRILTIIALLFATPMLAGCVKSTGTTDFVAIGQATKEENGTLFVYRTPKFYGTARGVYVYNNGILLGVLNDGELLKSKLNDGHNLIRMVWGSHRDTVYIEAEPDKNYYFTNETKGGLITPIKVNFVQLTKKNWLKLQEKNPY